MMNSVVAAGAYNARRARLALERLEAQGATVADRDAYWQGVIAERDRVWQQATERMWRMGWDQGFNSGAEWQREQQA